MPCPGVKWVNTMPVDTLIADIPNLYSSIATTPCSQLVLRLDHIDLHLIVHYILVLIAIINRHKNWVHVYKTYGKIQLRKISLVFWMGHIDLHLHVWFVLDELFNVITHQWLSAHAQKFAVHYTTVLRWYCIWATLICLFVLVWMMNSSMIYVNKER